MARWNRRAVFVAIVATLIALGPLIYNHMDRRPYNRRTTAEEAVIPNDLNSEVVIVTGASYALYPFCNPFVV